MRACPSDSRSSVVLRITVIPSMFQAAGGRKAERGRRNHGQPAAVFKSWKTPHNVAHQPELSHTSEPRSKKSWGSLFSTLGGHVRGQKETILLLRKRESTGGRRPIISFNLPGLKWNYRLPTTFPFPSRSLYPHILAEGSSVGQGQGRCHRS